MRQWHIADDWMYRDGYTLLSQIKEGDQRSLVHFDQRVEPIDRLTAVPHDAGILLTADDAQQVMNELWRVGVRPKDGSGAIAHTKAMQSHLSDLRAIAFKALEIQPSKGE